MNTPETQLADAQHPWIGLAPFTEGNREFFAGRGGEIEDLIRLVRRESLTLLYGVSGLGKTSLLQAGFFPALRAEDGLPVPIRLDYLDDAPPLAAQVLAAITAAAVAACVESAVPCPGGTLWEYFHREGNHFWSARNDLVTPCLVFDQFEEFFTLGRETPARAARAAAFIRELADLVENRPPAALRDDPQRAREFRFQPAPLKVIFAMREDYLADLDRIRAHFRALGQNHLRLLPMGEGQARQVIALGAPLLAPGVEDRIVRFVAGGVAEAGEEITVAPALLSLVLRELNERRLARGPEAKITPDLLDLEQEKIFEEFYLRSVRDFPVAVRTFIEDELLTTSGHRNSCALDDALTRPEVTLPVLNELVNRRLLAYEDRHRTRRVELTHDVLIPVIKASRDSRLAREALAQAERLRAQQAAQRRKQRITAAVACALAVTLVATIWGGYYAFVQEHRTYYRTWAKRKGFPEGIDRISEAEARRLPLSIRLIHKGIAWDGWKVRWKPASRLEAVNGLLELTTNHGIVTYLWRGDFESPGAAEDRPLEKGEQLGLRRICQWEFVATEKGEIIYERGLDRDGRMVYGLIYSPLGAGDPNTRLARFVGPDGFPQLQRQSAAEYVLILYDKDGWEERIEYRDGKNLAAVGPDGAFGQAMQHNDRGQLTRILSLNANREYMIDSAGNCGMQEEYDESGRLTEQKSLGPDLQPMPIKGGWVTCKYEYDRFGRLRRAALHGVDGEPVLHTESYHAFEKEYDGRGNEVAVNYLGVDGAPTLLTVGYATVRSSYDEHGWVTRQTYHGVDSEPVLHTDGNHGYEAQYDREGNPLVVTYLDLDSKPAPITQGYAILQRSYNDRGWMTRMSFHGVNGEPVLHRDGHHGWEPKYDAHGNQIEVTYFGLAGKPVLLSGGYAITRSKYDSDGHELETAYFDAEARPTLERVSGLHRIVKNYDARGKLSRVSYYGTAGEPILHKEGYHGWEESHDDRGNQTELTYLGLDGKPNSSPRGYAILRTAYDASGKLIRQSYHGVEGEPVLLKEGHHGWKADHDQRGNEIERTFIGLDGRPIVGAEGWAVVRTKYDHSEAKGRWTEQAYYDAQERLVMGPHGFARQSLIFHPDGREETINRGTDDQPAFNPLVGYAIRKTDPRKRGSTTESYHGPDGALITGPEGYAEARRRWGDDGALLEESYFGPRGQPVPGPEGHHRMTLQPGSPAESAKYFDPENRVFVSPGFDGLVPIIYINQIFGIQQPAAKIGLRVGDCTWSYGDWSFPDALKRERQVGTKRDDIAAKIAQALFAERDRLSDQAVPIVVLRQDRPVKLLMPPLPTKMFGMKLNSRFVPASTYEAMMKSAAASSEPR